MYKKKNIAQWSIVEDGFSPEKTAHYETIFSLGNGYLGVRGGFEEAEPHYLKGTYINGFFETQPIAYGEQAYGYAKNRQTMLNVTDGTPLTVLVDNEPFSLLAGSVEFFRRTLDMRKGILKREVTWRSPGGKRLHFVFHRLVSFEQPHIIVVAMTMKLLEGEADIQVFSRLNGHVRNQAAQEDPRTGSYFKGEVLKLENREIKNNTLSLTLRTRSSGFTLHTAMEHRTLTPRPIQTTAGIQGKTATMEYRVRLSRGEEFSLEKYLVYLTSLDTKAELQEEAGKKLKTAVSLGFEELCRRQELFLRDFWHHSDVRVEADEGIQQALRFNMFQLLQSTGTNGRTNIAAKGLTGEGYEGHYFWDSEIYVLPFFTYTRPAVAIKLLEYRYNTLDKARKRALEMAGRGALYPWRTIAGEETSPYFPAGTAQFHINADIIYALRRYVDVSGNLDFLAEQGAEMVFETARFWMSLGDFVESQGSRFCINGVTGPDEYTALVNNNLYTNLMARENLDYAVWVANWLKGQRPARFDRLKEKITLDVLEIEQWQKAARNMYIPYDEAAALYPQDDSFFQKARWDFKHTPQDKYPLLLHYHPLVIYRHQVLKQPDVIMAMFLLGHHFAPQEKIRNFHYYEPLTTGDSSLSPCIQGVLAAEVGEVEKAYSYFLQTLRMDLDDVHGNAKDGIHTAAMAGSWISVVYGFAGMRDSGGKLSFAPHLPATWKKVEFRLQYKQRLLKVALFPHDCSYSLVQGDALEIVHQGEPLLLVPQETVRRPVRD